MNFSSLLILICKCMKKNVSIDISSKTLDICIKENGSCTFKKINNEVKSIFAFFKPINYPDTVVSMENTGRYNWNLYEVLAQLQCTVYVISPIHIKKSLGLVRGKNDKIDSKRIGEFVEEKISKLTPWKPCPKNIQKIKVLMTERTARMKMIKQLSCHKKDYKLMERFDLKEDLSVLNKKLAEDIRGQIKEIEVKIKKIIKEDQELNHLSSLIKSVTGVGDIVSWAFLAKTEGFTIINDPRKMACYSGVAPYGYDSGTSIKSKPRVSQYADKSMKSLLHLAAMTVIQRDNEMADYYKRKVNEGKNKMSVLNAVRNKIIHRVFATVKNQKKYCVNLE